MENTVLLTGLATFGVLFLYYLDSKLSGKDKTTGDYIKTYGMVAGGIYLALMNHSIPKKVLQEIVEVGPANF